MHYDLLRVLNNIARGYKTDLRPFRQSPADGGSIFARGGGIVVKISSEQGLWYCESEVRFTSPTDRGEIEQGVIGPDPITAFLSWLDEKGYSFPPNGFL
jgi:hypothetical protein